MRMLESISFSCKLWLYFCYLNVCSLTAIHLLQHFLELCFSLEIKGLGIQCASD